MITNNATNGNGATAARRSGKSTARGLIVHADDFGETEEISRGICLGLDAGVVTSTTILTNMPGTAFAVGQARRYGPLVSFGLHVNLCEGRPLTKAGSLTGPDSLFWPKRQLAARALTRRLDPNELLREIEAQASLLIDSGVRVSHIDGHKHLHQLPVVRDAVVNVARKFGIERVRRSLSDRVQVPSLSGIVRQVLAARAGRLFAENGLRFPSRLIDVVELMNNEREDALARRTEGVGIVEIFCHPGTGAADLEKPGSCQRSRELDFLLSRRWATMLRATGIPTISYWEI